MLFSIKLFVLPPLRLCRSWQPHHSQPPPSYAPGPINYFNVTLPHNSGYCRCTPSVCPHQILHAFLLLQPTASLFPIVRHLLTPSDL
jgi:hypothetical protein